MHLRLSKNWNENTQKETPISSKPNFGLALAFFTLSVIARLISGGLQLLTNIKTHQSIITNKQQLLAQEAARNVSSYVKEQFSVLETAVWLTNMDELSQEAQKEILSSLLGRQTAFRHLILFKKDKRLPLKRG